ncbi:hypothetical protein CEXT_641041 [Caerostris extrusa]|uniref:Uncharacterized protein n=1 Tax=Caerostris extrusa TaxID=172846 RepID=A0AAV4MZ37_CAEEX|nr:hypothetical protein CEXT_641041 [Caerostris extrusa]
MRTHYHFNTPNKTHLHLSLKQNEKYQKAAIHRALSLKHSFLNPDPNPSYLVQTRCFRPIQKQNKWPLSVCLGWIISTTVLSPLMSDGETALFCASETSPSKPSRITSKCSFIKAYR